MGFRGMVGALLLVFALGGNARAGSSTGSYARFGLFSCADFLNRYSAEVAARNAYGGSGDRLYTPDYIALKYYVNGWLSAYNMMAMDTYNIVPNGSDGAILWLINYCNKNPLNTFDDGLQALIKEAYPSRQQNAPGQ